MNIDQLQRLIEHLYCAALSGQGLISQHCTPEMPIDRNVMAAIVKGIRLGQSPDQISSQTGVDAALIEKIKAELKNRYVPVMVWGEAGIGKSETVRGVADRLDIGFIDLRLGQLEPGDLLGQPRSEKVYPCVYDWESGADPEVLAMRFSQSHLYRYIVENHAEVAQGKSPGKIIEEAVALAESSNYKHLVDFQTVYATPSWFPAPNTHGILFLDELNRSHEDVRAAIFQLILDRRMHTLQLPRGWIIVSANNPPSREYGEVDEMNDKAFRSRFLHTVLEPTVEEWLEYAQETNVDPTIRSVIRTQPDLLGLVRMGDNVIPDASRTPRTWVMLNNIMEGLPPDILLEVASGLIGPAAAAAWSKLRLVRDQPVLAHQLLAGYDLVRPLLHKFINYPDPVFDADGKPVIDEHTGQQQVIMQPRTDMVAVTFDSLTPIMEERPLTPTESDAVVAFLSDTFANVEDGGLGMKDIALQYLRFWSKKPGGHSVVARTTEDVRAVLEQAGLSARVEEASRGSRRRRRRPQFEQMQGIPMGAQPRMAIGDWAYGELAAQPAPAYAW